MRKNIKINIYNDYLIVVILWGHIKIILNKITYIFTYSYPYNQQEYNYKMYYHTLFITLIY